MPDTTTENEYREELRKIGLQKLAECVKINTVNFELAIDDDVGLGDIIDVSINEHNILMTVRVAEIQLKNQNNITKRTMTVGTPLMIRRI